VQPHGRHGLVAVGGDDRAVAVELEGDPEQPADGGVVVGDQDSGGEGREVRVDESQ
jgi:hypothetical protein